MMLYRSKYRLVDDSTINRYITPTWLGRMFRIPPEVVVYRGRCTVWMDMSTERTVGTWMSAILHDVWKADQYKGY